MKGVGGKTNEVIESFKTWDGNAFIKSHLAWLKGTYQLSRAIMLPSKGLDKTEEDGEGFAKPQKVKEKPFINYAKQDKHLVTKTLGRRQAIRYWRDQKAGF